MRSMKFDCISRHAQAIKPKRLKASQQAAATSMMSYHSINGQPVFVVGSPLFHTWQQNAYCLTSSGLWSLCRYPNYFGEFCVWIGIWLMCIPSFRGGYWAATIGPLYVVAQICGISGIPLQEKQQKERWGKEPAFQEYRANTWLLLPLPK